MYTVNRVKIALEKETSSWTWHLQHIVLILTHFTLINMLKKVHPRDLPINFLGPLSLITDSQGSPEFERNLENENQRSQNIIKNLRENIFREEQK